MLLRHRFVLFEWDMQLFQASCDLATDLAMESEQSTLWNGDFGRWPGLSFWLVLPLPCLAWGRLKLVWVVSSFVPSPGHTAPSTADTRGLRANVPEAVVAGREQLAALWAGTALSLHSWLWIPGLRWWGEEKPSSHHSVGHQGELCSQEDPCHLAVRRARMCPDRNSNLCSFQTGSALPKAWGCLSNTLLCPVSCSIFLFLLLWHAKLVEFLLPKLLPLKFSLSITLI